MSFDRECQLCDDVCYEIIPMSKTKKRVFKRNLKNHLYYDNRCICLECWNKWSAGSTPRYITKNSPDEELILPQ